ncbi:hypothetical protein [Nonomuraea sp. NPDC048901]|uniref:hypothetical protein n=1 Tax=Nonomuraea sp. NPDC048901 TaxID=3155627 RepID=UPI0033E07CBA
MRLISIIGSSVADAGSHTREFDQGRRGVLTTTKRISDADSELRARYVLGRVLFASNRLKEAEEQFRIVHELSVERAEKVVTDDVMKALAVVAGQQRRANDEDLSFCLCHTDQAAPHEIAEQTVSTLFKQRTATP